MNTSVTERSVGRFVNDREDIRRFATPTRRPSRWNSARFRRTCERSNLGQYYPKRTTDLLRRHFPALAFPREPAAVEEAAGQMQLVYDDRDDESPQVELFRRPKTRLLPEQILFSEPKAMLQAEASPVDRRYLTKSGLVLAPEDEPALLGVSFGVGGTVTDDVEERNQLLWMLLEMEPSPAGDFQAIAFLIQPLPRFVGDAVGARTVGLDD